MLDAGLKWSVSFQRVHSGDQLQPRPHGALGVVFVSLRVAEVDQHAIAQMFGDESVKPAHGLGDASLVGGDDLAKVLRVHAGGEGRRADKV